MTLPYDQIRPERRTILDVTGRLGDDGHNGVLGVALAQWAARDDTKADPEARRAANTAIDSIDAMLGELHALRARLVSEVRASDDASAARIDAMLSRPVTLTAGQAPPQGGRSALMAVTITDDLADLRRPRGGDLRVALGASQVGAAQAGVRNGAPGPWPGDPVDGVPDAGPQWADRAEAAARQAQGGVRLMLDAL